MSNKPSVLRKLQAIYDGLPSIDCQRKCHTHCGPVIPQRIEKRNVLETTGFEFRQPWIGINELTCPQLTQDGLCSVYEARPAICRIWGLTEALKCPYGCLPERFLTEDDARRIMRAVYDLTS